MNLERTTIMAQITKSNYKIWHQRENIIDDILNEVECTETEHFRYWFRGCRHDQHKIRACGIGRKAISLSTLKHGINTLQELNGEYSLNDTVEQTRVKSLRYILAKAYYHLCCELLQISCMKKDQHIKSVAFAVGTGEDIYQHLLKCKADRTNKKKPHNKTNLKVAKVSRFEMLDFGK
jgi:hypothetical protein